MSDLKGLFAPRSIAVIGAGRERGSVGGEIFHNILANGFTGAVYPVNPKAKVVQSVRAYPSIKDVPDEVDLAVIVVPRDFVQAVAEDCGRKGVKALIVISAGFGEVGEKGKALQDKLLATVKEYGMRMVGPNCLGVLVTDPAVNMDATFAPTWPPPGRVSFSSQSGALGLAILDHAKALGIGVRSFVSVGNKADISGNDLIEWWEAEAETDVILLYLESFGNPRKFIKLARRISRKKPIVAVKSGRTAAGSRAASSHTGALAGADAAVDALFRQTGVVRTDTIEELFDMAMLLANQPVPRSNKLAILTNAGGPGIMATDACESRGLVVTPLAERTMEKLRAFLPAEASVKNPVDMIASASAEGYGKAVQVLLEDPDVDSLLVIFVPPLVTEAPAVANAVRNALATTPEAKDKTILACFLGTRGVPESLATLQAGKVPSYMFPEAAAIALSRAVDYGTWRRAPEESFPAFPVAKDKAAQIVASAREKSTASFWLDAGRVRSLLEAYGIRMPRTQFAKTAEEAARFAKEWAVPVAVKLESRTLTHKTEVGGVKLGIEGGPAAQQAFQDIAKGLERLGKQSEMDGVVVQEMAPQGVETIVGVSLDPAFGHLLMYGLGGVAVEILKDVAWGVAPIADVDAERMIDGVKGSKMLEGFRGAPRADRAALKEVILRVSQLVGDFPEIEEMDLNPVRVLPQGKGAIAVDARIRLSSRS